jgi:integrase
MYLNKFGSDKAKETVEKVNTHIRSCVQDAIEEQIIQHDFTRKAVLTWTNPANKPEEKHLNYFETKRLQEVIYSLLNQGLGYYLILLGLTSGARFGELVGLTRRDFDFKNNTITINKTWGYAKRHPQGFGPTKKEASNRTIKLDKKTMKAFRRLF